MRLGSVRPGDIVLVDRRGRAAMAEVTSHTDGGLRVQPMAKGFTWCAVTSREVIGIWRATAATRERGVRPLATRGVARPLATRMVIALSPDYLARLGAAAAAAGIPVEKMAEQIIIANLLANRAIPEPRSDA